MGKLKKHRKRVLPIISRPEPGNRVVLEPSPGVSPVIKGTGDLDLLCGKCRMRLVEGIVEGQVQNIVIRCPNCESYNEILFSIERWKPDFLGSLERKKRG